MDNNEVRDAGGLPALMLSSTILTQSEMKKQVDTIADLVERGVLNPLNAITQLTYLIKMADQAKDTIKERAIEEAGKYHKQQEIKIYGATVQISNNSKYDYAACGDPTWNRANEEKKEREQFLKSVKKPMGVANEDTGGETITINPPGKKVTDIIKISFPYGT